MLLLKMIIISLILKYSYRITTDEKNNSRYMNYKKYLIIKRKSYFYLYLWVYYSNAYLIKLF